MMADEMDDRERATWAAVDDALRTCPLAPTPPGLSAAVMARLRATPAGREPLPPFRLAWIDIAISVFAAGMAGLGMLLWQSIPPMLKAQAQIQAVLLFQAMNPALLLPALLGGAGLAGVAILCAAAVFARGRSAVPGRG